MINLEKVAENSKCCEKSYGNEWAANVLLVSGKLLNLPMYNNKTNTILFIIMFL